MDTPSETGSLQIEVSDFGPIENAKVDLRPLTVFVGPSNTGKSYLAILIYALHRFFVQRSLPFRMHEDGSLTIPSRTTPDLSDESVAALLELARTFAEAFAKPNEDKVTLSRPAAEVLEFDFGRRAGDLVDELARCFGLQKTRSLVRKGRSNARVAIRYQGPGNSEGVAHALDLSRNPQFTMALPRDLSIPIVPEPEPDDMLGHFLELGARMSQDASDANGRRISTSMLFSLFGLCVLPAAIGPLFSPAYYLPAARTGAMHLYRLVARSLIAEAASPSPSPATATSMLTGVMADFLGQLIEKGTSVASKPPKEPDLGKSLEAAILDGSVRIEQSAAIGIPQFIYRPKGWKDDLELTNASSMVSELAPVVLYLRHLVRPGNVLIVEEPESHMHPGMQVEFMRQLAAVVKAGVRVIVTTHSEWMIEELGNIVRRSVLPENERKGTALEADEVGTWLFKPTEGPTGSVVTEIRLDEDGQYPCGFDDVAIALHNDWASITSGIEGSS